VVAIPSSRSTVGLASSTPQTMAGWQRFNVGGHLRQRKAVSQGGWQRIEKCTDGLSQRQCFTRFEVYESPLADLEIASPTNPAITAVGHDSAIKGYPCESVSVQTGGQSHWCPEAACLGQLKVTRIWQRSRVEIPAAEVSQHLVSRKSGKSVLQFERADLFGGFRARLTGAVRG
jgi:hypothetical protein